MVKSCDHCNFSSSSIVLCANGAGTPLWLPDYCYDNHQFLSRYHFTNYTVGHVKATSRLSDVCLEQHWQSKSRKIMSFAISQLRFTVAKKTGHNRRWYVLPIKCKIAKSLLWPMFGLLRIQNPWPHWLTYLCGIIDNHQLSAYVAHVVHLTYAIYYWTHGQLQSWHSNQHIFSLRSLQRKYWTPFGIYKVFCA